MKVKPCNKETMSGRRSSFNRGAEYREQQWEIIIHSFLQHLSSRNIEHFTNINYLSLTTMLLRQEQMLSLSPTTQQNAEAFWQCAATAHNSLGCKTKNVLSNWNSKTGQKFGIWKLACPPLPSQKEPWIFNTKWSGSQFYVLAIKLKRWKQGQNQSFNRQLWKKTNL